MVEVRFRVLGPLGVTVDKADVDGALGAYETAVRRNLEERVLPWHRRALTRLADLS